MSSQVPITVKLSAVAANNDASVAASTGLRLVGYDIVEQGSASFEVEIVDGITGAGGTGRKGIKGISGSSKHEWFWPGVDCSSGISINHTSGTVDIYLHYINVQEG